MTTFGDVYARCYDLLYRDKSYADEARYVRGLIEEHGAWVKTLLELGCGTGRYTRELLAMDYAVRGVDVSAEMLEQARARCSGNAEFSCADVTRLNLQRKFDCAVALFHVLDYLTSNEQLESAFARTADHLVPGGVFVFDFWYGPAVLTERPSVRVKHVADESLEVVRTSRPVLLPNENVVEVHFENQIHVLASAERFEEREIHRMRYLFLPEIDGWLRAARLERCGAYRWMSREGLGFDSWYGVVVARKLG